MINAETTIWRAEVLTKALTEGYGKSLADVDYNTPDAETLRQLQANIWVFSASADDQMTRDLSAALIDADGKQRSFNDFKIEADKIGKTYNQQRLLVEYNHAVASSQMASNWVGYQQNKDIAPNLKYQTVGDDRVRQAHKPLDGIIKPIDDGFWDTHYPPNDWGCRCDVQAVDDDPTEVTRALPKLPKMFATNLAKSGVIYPDGHPYMINDDILGFGDAAYSKDNIYNGKGSVYESGRAFDKSRGRDLRYVNEYQLRIDTAKILANHLDKDVFITPEIDTMDWRYAYFFDKAPVPGKLPDFKINNDFYELKSYEGNFKYSKIGQMIHKSATQCDRVILKLNHNVDLQKLKTRIEGFKNKETGIKTKEVIVIDNNNKVLLNIFK